MSTEFAVKYPEVEVQLTGEDGNAYAIIGAVSRALERQVSHEASSEFKTAAFESESYDALLRLAMTTVSVW